MIVFAFLAIVAVTVAAVAGTRILAKEYLPLLRELSRSQSLRGETPEPLLWEDEEEK